jgi:uncharacterized protein YoxC
MKNINEVMQDLSNSIDMNIFFDGVSQKATREMTKHEKAIMQAIADLGTIAADIENKGVDYSDAQE